MMRQEPAPLPSPHLGILHVAVLQEVLLPRQPAASPVHCTRARPPSSLVRRGGGLLCGHLRIKLQIEMRTQGYRYGGQALL